METVFRGVGTLKHRCVDLCRDTLDTFIKFSACFHTGFLAGNIWDTFRVCVCVFVLYLCSRYALCCERTVIRHLYSSCSTDYKQGRTPVSVSAQATSVWRNGLFFWPNMWAIRSVSTSAQEGRKKKREKGERNVMNCCITVYLCVCVLFCCAVQVVSCLNLLFAHRSDIKQTRHPSLNTLCNADDCSELIFLSSVRLYLLRLQCCSLHKYLPLMASKWTDFSVSERISHTLLRNRFLLNVSFSFFLLQISWHWNADVSRATYSTQTAIKHNVSKASQQRLQGNQSTARPRSHEINIKEKNTTMLKKIIAGDWNHDNKGRNTEIKDPGLLETRFSTICICYSNGHRSSQKYLQIVI